MVASSMDHIPMVSYGFLSIQSDLQGPGTVRTCCFCSGAAAPLDPGILLAGSVPWILISNPTQRLMLKHQDNQISIGELSNLLILVD